MGPTIEGTGAKMRQIRSHRLTWNVREYAGAFQSRIVRTPLRNTALMSTGRRRTSKNNSGHIAIGSSCCYTERTSTQKGNCTLEVPWKSPHREVMHNFACSQPPPNSHAPSPFNFALPLCPLLSLSIKVENI